MPDDSADCSDSAFATTSIDYALIAATMLLLLTPMTLPIVATMPLLLKKYVASDGVTVPRR